MNKITAVGVFYIAWLGVALKVYGSAENADCLFVIFIVVRYSFLGYAFYWFLSQLVYGCNGFSDNFSPSFRSRVLRSYYCG